jgi:hypothetical protein
MPISILIRFQSVEIHYAVISIVHIDFFGYALRIVVRIIEVCGIFQSGQKNIFK